jgi:hypothetical protein
MVKKIYNVVLQSSIGDGPTQSSDTYFYDWTQLPDVPYVVTFSFTSSVNPMTQFGQYASLYVDLSQSYNQLATCQTAVQYAYRGQFLGNLLYGVVAANNYLYAENNTNPPTYLNGRPRSNNFTVEIHSTPTVDYAPFTSVYCLILSFQEV